MCTLESRIPSGRFKVASDRLDVHSKAELLEQKLFQVNCNGYIMT